MCVYLYPELVFSLFLFRRYLLPCFYPSCCFHCVSNFVHVVIYPFFRPVSHQPSLSLYLQTICLVNLTGQWSWCLYVCVPTMTSLNSLGAHWALLSRTKLWSVGLDPGSSCVSPVLLAIISHSKWIHSKLWEHIQVAHSVAGIPDPTPYELFSQTKMDHKALVAFMHNFIMFK